MIIGDFNKICSADIIVTQSGKVLKDRFGKTKVLVIPDKKK